MLLWLKDYMKAQPDTELFECKYYDPYQQNVGIYCAAEGVHKSPTALPLAVLCSFNPPAEYYRSPPVTDNVFMFCGAKMDSPQKSMRFASEARQIRGLESEESWQLIIDIRAVDVARGTVAPLGWTVVSLLDKSRPGQTYVNTGVFMVRRDAKTPM